MNQIEAAYVAVDKYEGVASGLNLIGRDLTKIVKAMQEPSTAALKIFLSAGEEKSPTAQWMAKSMYNRFPMHNCYENDKFYIAHAFDLSAQKKHRTALALVENCMAEYFEPKTHGQFDLSGLLEKLGAPLHIPYIEGKMYYGVQHRKIKSLAEKLKIRNKELGECARSVINWSLRQAFGIEGKTRFGAGSALTIDELADIAGAYLPADKEIFGKIWRAEQMLIREPEKYHFKLHSQPRV